ncbi:hypothetical protein PoB_000427900 [Plakobranchus ocellatus]|uniref:Uncharacterized protein n=1 Tax=Plakobranchus ocellatus TaxID=259542 RepID=A0AAV3Y466_9GAST|nr:hypothetical protein PoB_000427900 [Plakobranchus ocellatus]
MYEDQSDTNSAVRCPSSESRFLRVINSNELGEITDKSFRSAAKGHIDMSFKRVTSTSSAYDSKQTVDRAGPDRLNLSLHIASQQQGDLRLSGFPSGWGSGSEARTPDRRIPEDLHCATNTP